MSNKFKKYFVYHDELGYIKFHSRQKKTFYDYPETRASFERLEDAQKRLSCGLINNYEGKDVRHECRVVEVEFSWEHLGDA
jgi:hypothetical protein